MTQLTHHNHNFKIIPSALLSGCYINSTVISVFFSGTLEEFLCVSMFVCSQLWLQQSSPWGLLLTGSMLRWILTCCRDLWFSLCGAFISSKGSQQFCVCNVLWTWADLNDGVPQWHLATYTAAAQTPSNLTFIAAAENVHLSLEGIWN